MLTMNGKKNERAQLLAQIEDLSLTQKQLLARLEVIEELLLGQRHNLRQLEKQLQAQQEPQKNPQTLETPKALAKSAAITKVPTVISSPTAEPKAELSQPTAEQSTQARIQQVINNQRLHSVLAVQTAQQAPGVDDYHNQTAKIEPQPRWHNPQHWQLLESFCSSQGYHALGYDQSPNVKAATRDGAQLLVKLSSQAIAQSQIESRRDPALISLFTAVQLRDQRGKRWTLDCFFMSAHDGALLQFCAPEQRQSWIDFATGLGLDSANVHCLSAAELSVRKVAEKCQLIFDKLAAHN